MDAPSLLRELAAQAATLAQLDADLSSSNYIQQQNSDSSLNVQVLSDLSPERAETEIMNARAAAKFLWLVEMAISNGLQHSNSVSRVFSGVSNIMSTGVTVKKSSLTPWPFISSGLNSGGVLPDKEAKLWINRVEEEIQRGVISGSVNSGLSSSVIHGGVAASNAVAVGSVGSTQVNGVVAMNSPSGFTAASLSPTAPTSSIASASSNSSNSSSNSVSSAAYSEVGEWARVRLFLRLALNDGSLADLLRSLLWANGGQAAKKHFRPDAIMRQRELQHAFLKILDSLSVAGAVSSAGTSPPSSSTTSSAPGTPVAPANESLLPKSPSHTTQVGGSILRGKFLTCAPGLPQALSDNNFWENVAEARQRAAQQSQAAKRSVELVVDAARRHNFSHGARGGQDGSDIEADAESEAERRHASVMAVFAGLPPARFCMLERERLRSDEWQAHRRKQLALLSGEDGSGEGAAGGATSGLRGGVGEANAALIAQAEASQAEVTAARRQLTLMKVRFEEEHQRRLAAEERTRRASEVVADTLLAAHVYRRSAGVAAAAAVAAGVPVEKVFGRSSPISAEASLSETDRLGEALAELDAAAAVPLAPAEPVASENASENADANATAAPGMDASFAEDDTRLLFLSDSVFSGDLLEAATVVEHGDAEWRALLTPDDRAEHSRIRREIENGSAESLQATQRQLLFDQPGIDPQDIPAPVVVASAGDAEHTLDVASEEVDEAARAVAEQDAAKISAVLARIERAADCIRDLKRSDALLKHELTRISSPVAAAPQPS